MLPREGSGKTKHCFVQTTQEPLQDWLLVKLNLIDLATLQKQVRLVPQGFK